MKKKIFGTIAGIILTSTATSHANGDVVIFSNPWLDYESFGYSEAYSTSGASARPQSLAQRFVATQDYDLHSVRWWGAMNTAHADTDPNWVGPEEGQPNLKGFQVIIWNSDFTQQIHNQTYMLDQIESTRMPGNPGEWNQYVNGNNREYSYYATFDNAASILAGTYHLNIGAIYHNYGFAGWYNYEGTDYPMMHDSWIWSTGENSLTDNPNSLYFTTNNPLAGLEWGEWTNNYALNALQGGASFLYAPTPGAIALLAIGGIFGTRRRRS